LNGYYIYIFQKRGSEILTANEKEDTLVQDLLNFKDRIDRICIESFQKNDEFQNSIKESFEFFINSKHNKPAELIGKLVIYFMSKMDLVYTDTYRFSKAKYADNILKSGSKVKETKMLLMKVHYNDSNFQMVSDQEMDNVLDKLLILFRFLQSKLLMCRFIACGLV
jgi:hypothetical protein